MILELHDPAQRQMFLEYSRAGAKRGSRQCKARRVLGRRVVGKTNGDGAAGRNPTIHQSAHPRYLVRIIRRGVTLKAEQNDYLFAVESRNRPFYLALECTSRTEHNAAHRTSGDDLEEAQIGNVGPVKLDGINPDRGGEGKTPFAKDVEVELDARLRCRLGKPGPYAIRHFEGLEQIVVFVVRRGELFGVDELELGGICPRCRSSLQKKRCEIGIAFKPLCKFSDDFDVRLGAVGQSAFQFAGLMRRASSVVRSAGAAGIDVAAACSISTN
jgi:hypothetical protein